MISRIRSVALLLLVAAAAAIPSARAQLYLTGNIYGAFQDPGLPHTTVTNGPVVSTFESGDPYRPYPPYNDTKTSITFTGASFTDLGSGDPLVLQSIKFKNGITLLGTTATNATLDLFVNVSNLGISDLKVTTLTFDIDNTDNSGVSNIPDLFKIGYTPLAEFTYGDYLVKFTIDFSDPAWVTDGVGIPEGKKGLTGDIYVTMSFTPIPEPSTYAIAGAALLGGVVLLRRFKKGSVAAHTA